MFLEKYTKKGFSIWIDTCSILHEQFQTCMNNIAGFLTGNNYKIKITQTVLNELTKHTSSSDEELKANATKALELITQGNLKNIFEVYGDSSHSFADNDFLALFTQLRLKENILFITQDVALASDVWDLGDSRSVRSKCIEVAKITKNGLLEEFEIDDDFEDDYEDYEDNINRNYTSDLDGESIGDINARVKGNIKGDYKNDINEILDGNILGDMYGDINGKMNGTIQGSMYGDINGILNGNILGNMNGDIYGKLNGKVMGKMTGTLHVHNSTNKGAIQKNIVMHDVQMDDIPSPDELKQKIKTAFENALRNLQ
ncbi:MAG: hypothetical protein IKO57_13350 [Treponema sp.]|nr:hypothetical protein [Treponema sp.]